jgi:predicted nuclease of predicted toxin-antitoxin system
MLPRFGDESVAEAILVGLRHAGIDVAWSDERNLKGLPDPAVANLALSERRVLLTTDADFLRLSKSAGARQLPFPPVVFWRQQQRMIGEVIESVLLLIDRDDYETLAGLTLFA